MEVRKVHKTLLERQSKTALQLGVGGSALLT